MTNQNINESIQRASKVIGKTWPLYSFVTSNPLSGYEDLSFEKAVKQADAYLGAKVFPEVSVFKAAWDMGHIDQKELIRLLKAHGMDKTPEQCLKHMEAYALQRPINKGQDLDRIMSKWLAAFLDEGLAEWTMPSKKKGFYKAWRSLARYDRDIGVTSKAVIPESSEKALLSVLRDFSENDYDRIFKTHLAALPGWVGYINHRAESGSEWQKKYPITLTDYLAVRLWVAKKLGLEILPESDHAERNLSLLKIQYIWLKAWEATWQKELSLLLEKSTEDSGLPKRSGSRVDAQMVFCIDTRSELIRRHIESKGHYETFGYAGFFGIAMDYKHLSDGISRKSCPPILTSAYQTQEIPQANKQEAVKAYQKKKATISFAHYFMRRMKNLLPSAFGFVEGSGIFYGISLVLRTLVPGYLYASKKKQDHGFESICEPEINKYEHTDDHSTGIPLNEKVSIVKSAFDLMGWETFAPLVLFVGHGSHSANNAFGSSLDCGACAASPGRHNARMLAKLANMKEVRAVLAEEYQMNIPDHTIFIGAEHNTTTDDIVIFDSHVPASHSEFLKNVKEDLIKAQQTATQERLGTDKNSVGMALRKANNWSETRPEWGLAKNAGFIVGPREITKGTNLDGRCFLHSYNWESDRTGKALEAIMQGPMVVTQWINNHYYFSTVDNELFGGGSKITHNITGKFGVVQGNGGDLKMGLPLQSLKASDEDMYHQPLRLSVVIQAPLQRVIDILSRNQNLKGLLDNEWIYLMVMDPTQNNAMKKYNKDMDWIAMSEIINEHVKMTKEIEHDQLMEVID